MRDVMDDLEDLEGMVDDEEERAKVRETMQTAEEARDPGSSTGSSVGSASVTPARR